MTALAYATTPPRKTSLEPATDVSRAATSPPVHDSAVASVSPRARQRVEHDLLDRPLVAREQVLLERLGERALRAPRPRLGARLDEQVDVDLELPRADRRLDPVSVAAGVGERLARPPTRSRRRSAAHGAPAAAPARARAAPARSRARAATAAAARDGGPGQHDDRAAAGVEHQPGRRPGETERDRALRERRLLAHARLEVGVRPVQPLGDHARDGADLLVQPVVEHELPAGDPRDELDRAVVVRRPEPAGDEAEVGAQRPRASAASSSSGRSPTIVIRAGSSPSDERLRGEERAVQVRALAADELAAGDDDRGPRPRRLRSRARRERRRRR